MEDVQLPTRVIEIGVQSYQLRLWTRSGEEELCLPELSLEKRHEAFRDNREDSKRFQTRDFLGSHRTIPFGPRLRILPKRLSISYNWIDLLSTIQDNKSDLDKGVSIMGDIYKSLYLTLSATSSGLFLEDVSYARPSIN